MKRCHNKASELLDLFLNRFGDPPPQAMEASRERLIERFNSAIDAISGSRIDERDAVCPGVPQRNTSWRWVTVGMAVMLLAAIPIYMQRTETDSEVLLLPPIDATGDANPDALLMDAVSAHLSRTIPAPMEPIMVLIPAQSGVTQ